MSDPAIVVENLSKRYALRHGSKPGGTLRDRVAKIVRTPFRRDQDGSTETFWALEDINFHIGAGEVVGVIGRNGAGKSTLLKILSRITEPTQGRVTLHGRIASLLEVGTGFHGELSGRENIFLNGAILGMTRAEIRRKFDEIVAFAEVDRFLDTPVKHYSSGMYVRLAFAVAAHLEPEILIVDEVLAVGDLAFQQKCMGKMRAIAASEGRTVLFVSHNLVSVQQLCTSALHLDRGRLVGRGPVLEQITRYIGNLGPKETRVDLDRRTRALEPRGRVRLLVGELLGSSPESPGRLPFGQALQFKFEFRVGQRIDGVEIGVSLFNLQGLELVSTLSTWVPGPRALEPGSYAVEVDFGTLELRPDVYRVGLGLKSEFGLEDYIPEAMEFEVVPSDRFNLTNVSTTRGSSVRRAQFSVRPLEVARG